VAARHGAAAEAAAADQEWMGLAAAAGRLGLNRRTLSCAAKAGRLEARRDRLLWLTTLPAVEAWLEGARHRPGPLPGHGRGRPRRPAGPPGAVAGRATAPEPTAREAARDRADGAGPRRGKGHRTGEETWGRAARGSWPAVEAALRRRDLAPRVQERLEMVKGVALGQPLPELARRSGRAERTVRRWLVAFERAGIAALADAPRAGRPPRVDAPYQGALERAAATPPRDLGLPFDAWSSDRLSAYLAERTGVRIAPSRVRALLARRRDSRSPALRLGCAPPGAAGPTRPAPRW
jgi:transposase